MYKKNSLNNKRLPTTKRQPTFVSQRRNLENIQEKENEAVNNVLVGDSEDPKSQDAQEIIPSSQGHSEEIQMTQSRFLSQRHQFRATQIDIQCRGKNFFEISLINSKVKIGEFGCELTTEGDDPVSFIRRFRASISNNSENPRKFVEGFKNAFSLNDDESLKNAQKYLSGLIIKEALQSHVSQQTSLIQCFFAVASLRDEISNLLLENLKKYVKSKGEDADPTIIGLILVQFKFSDQILTSETYNTVYEEFFNILKSTKNEACRAAIISCFRDFDEFKHDDAVQRLMNMYENDYKFLTPFIEAFTEMCISDETKSKVKNVVQYILQNDCEPEQYPGIVKYLIYYSSDAVDIIENVRKNLKWSSNRQMQEPQSKVLQLLEKSVRPQKSKIVESWLKLIQSFEQKDQLKPIDFVVLLMIINIKEEKFQSVKKIFVQNVPKGFFNEEFLKKTFKIFSSIIEQYSGSLVELLSALHKITCHEINDFSTNCFKQMFLIDMNDRREIIGTLVQFLCEKTPNLPFSPFSRADFKITTINVLSEIAKDVSSAEDLLLNFKILLRVLDISKVKLSFITHRMFVELLCTLAYHLEVNGKRSNFERKKIDEEKERLQEHLEMSMNKLMCNPDMKIKQLGIIGGIKIVSSFVVNHFSSSEFTIDRNQKLSCEDLPEGEIRKAAEKIKFIFKSVNNDPIGLAMIYDELSLEFAPKRCKTNYVVNEIFLQWINEFLDEQFSPVIGTLINAELPETLSLQLDVDSEELEKSDYAVKFGLHIYDEKSSEIIFIAALFKTLRIIDQTFNGRLDNLRGYLVMPLILTEHFASNDDEISCCDLTEVKMKLDLYFHCVNWLRELISAFSHWSEEDEQTQKRIVKKRLKQLIKVEEILANLLREVPLSYYPPPAAFLDIELDKKNFDTFRKEFKTVAKVAPAKKKKKQNDTTAVDVIDETTVNQSDEISIRSSSKLHQFCREIDPHFIILLNEKYEFKSAELPDDRLGLRELNFMLEDALSKISVICNPRNAEQKGLYDPIIIITEMKDSILVSLVQIFTEIRDELIEMNLKAADDGNEQLFYTKDSNLLKNCFELILGIFDEIFSCPRLRWDKNKTLLVNTLKVLVSENELPRDVQAIDQVCLTIIESYESFQNYVKNCDTAFLLVKFLTTISKLSGSKTQCSTVTEMCKKFLGTPWKNSQGNEDHGSAVTSHLANLLEIYIADANLDQLLILVNEIQKEISRFSDKKIKHLKNFPSFTRQNSSVIVRVYLSKLTKLISSTKPSAMNYNFWLKSSEVMTQIHKIVKQFDSQNAYVSYIKNFVTFFKTYNIHGIAVLKKLTQDAEKFKHLVKVVLNLTREAHGIANEFKSRKNKSIRSLVPTLRQLFEKNTQLTKPLLNKAGIRNEELIFGPMQNYDTKRKPIASQSTSDTEVEDDENQVSDDDTVGDLQVFEAPPRQVRTGSARKRSTIL